MKITAGGLLRTTSGLNVRAGAGTGAAIVATAVKDALLHVLGAPSGGWVRVELWGWVTGAADGLYFEPDNLSGVKATVKRPADLVTVSTAGAWRFVTLAGYVSTGYVSVVDGP